MTMHLASEAKGKLAYSVQTKTPPTMGGVTPQDRELLGARTLYMAKKSLNAWRKLRGLEAKELGEVSGVGSTINNFLYKGHTPRVDVAERLAAAVGVGVEQIQWGKTGQVDTTHKLPIPKSLSDEELEGMEESSTATDQKSLNAWRKLRGLEVLELGAISGVGTTIGNFLYRGIVPKLDMAERLAAAVGVKASQVEWGKTEQVEIAELPPMPKSPPFDPFLGTPIVSDEQMRIALIWAEAGRSKKDVYEAMGVSHQTFYKVMQRYEEEHGPVMFRQTRVKKPSAHVQKQDTEKARKGSAKKEGVQKPSSRSRKPAGTIL